MFHDFFLFSKMEIFFRTELFELIFQTATNKNTCEFTLFSSLAGNEQKYIVSTGVQLKIEFNAVYPSTPYKDSWFSTWILFGSVLFSPIFFAFLLFCWYPLNIIRFDHFNWRLHPKNKLRIWKTLKFERKCCFVVVVVNTTALKARFGSWLLF